MPIQHAATVLGHNFHCNNTFLLRPSGGKIKHSAPAEKNSRMQDLRCVDIPFLLTVLALALDWIKSTQVLLKEVFREGDWEPGGAPDATIIASISSCGGRKTR
ncbi:hypothetical protein GUJ93_ZPchr0011g27925 [Zizania palustris]|uniref:Uncharacterized protein n=1 Tax=Zizania palustris TaxID=103762 RepID=A0A8J5WK63_ZIZPA|nr:hypothetical protein GUJ93_ZPchr0011g27925 [Zizania palustris]